MHVDALQARRTKAGAPVVHGINLLLWALHSLSATQYDLPRFRSLRAQFNRFVYLNERVEVVLTQQEPTNVRLNICVDGPIRSKVTIEFGDGVEDCPVWSAASLEPVHFAVAPLNLSFEQIAGRSGCLSFQMKPEDAAVCFRLQRNGLAPGLGGLPPTLSSHDMPWPALHLQRNVSPGMRRIFPARVSCLSRD